MRRLGLVAFVVLTACGGDDGTTPTASGVFPAEGFIGRQLRVEVSGDATNWSDSTTVSFGSDVTVGTVTVASPTDLFADITIKDTAAAGLADVTVTDGGSTFALAQAFSLKTPIDVSVVGTLAQGSVAFLSIKGHDFDTPFDATTDADGNFVNTSISGPDGVTFQLSSVADYDIEAVALIDVDAGASGALSVTSGPTEAQVVSPFGDITIAARTAGTVTSGTPATGTLHDATGTELFQFTPGAGPAAVIASSATDNGNANPQLIVLPGSGHFSDGFLLFPTTDLFGDVIRAGFGQIEATTSPMYAIYFDNSGLSGYQFSINASSVTLTSANEVATANDTAAQAQVFANSSPLLAAATLTDDTDVDFFTFTVTANDVGKRVRVITNGDPLTDALVEVLGGTTAANAVTLGGPSDDLDFQEDWTSDVIPAGTTKIFVKVSASQAGFFDPAHNTYEAAAFLVQ
jgi:hypothetical protein